LPLFLSLSNQNQSEIIPMSYKSKTEREYAYYQKQFGSAQAELDAFDAWAGFPRTDKAHAKVMERQQAKNRPSWAQLKAEFGLEVACAKYEQAIGAK
jgi:hypothetical protein